MPKFLITATDKNTGDTVYARVDRSNGLRFAAGHHVQRQPGEQHSAGFYKPEDGTLFAADRVLEFAVRFAETLPEKSWVSRPSVIVAPVELER